MNSNNQNFTRSRLAEAISRDPSKKADFSRAWESSKNPEVPKKTANSTKRSSDQELAKSIDLALESQNPPPESAATTLELSPINLAPGHNEKPNFVDPSNELVNTDHLDPNGSVSSEKHGGPSSVGTKDFLPPLAAQNKGKGPQVEIEKVKKPELKAKSGLQMESQPGPENWTLPSPQMESLGIGLILSGKRTISQVKANSSALEPSLELAPTFEVGIGPKLVGTSTLEALAQVTHQDQEASQAGPNGSLSGGSCGPDLGFSENPPESPSPSANSRV